MKPTRVITIVALVALAMQGTPAVAAATTTALITSSSTGARSRVTPDLLKGIDKESISTATTAYDNEIATAKVVITTKRAAMEAAENELRSNPTKESEARLDGTISDYWEAHGEAAKKMRAAATTYMEQLIPGRDQQRAVLEKARTHWTSIQQKNITDEQEIARRTEALKLLAEKAKLIIADPKVDELVKIKIGTEIQQQVDEIGEKKRSIEVRSHNTQRAAKLGDDLQKSDRVIQERILILGGEIAKLDNIILSDVTILTDRKALLPLIEATSGMISQALAQEQPRPTEFLNDSPVPDLASSTYDAAHATPAVPGKPNYTSALEAAAALGSGPPKLTTTTTPAKQP